MPPLIIAHRGNSSEQPENTRAAFESALQLGAPLVELDVRLTRDGVAVVIHDATLDRTTDGVGLVAQHTLAEIQALSAGFPGRFGAAFAGERVLALSEALSLLGGRARVLIELKKEEHEADNHDLERATIADARHAGGHGQVMLIAFDRRALAFCRDAAPEVPRGLLVHRAETEAIVAAAEALKVELVLPEKGLLSEGLCDAVRAAGRQVATWVVDDPLELDDLERYDLIGVGSNRPGLLLRHLRHTPRS
jgi:glycerophosphoryl diester phosphodiesterase